MSNTEAHSEGQVEFHRIHNLIKDPTSWKTGRQPATEAQISYATTLAEGFQLSRDEIQELGFHRMTKAEITQFIDAMDRDIDPREYAKSLHTQQMSQVATS